MVRHFRLKTCFPVFSSCVTLFLRDIFKNFLEPRFQSTSQFPPKNTYHMHTGPFFFMTIVCVTYPKLSYSLTLMVVSRFPPKNTYHMHRGLFFMWLLFTWHTPKKKFLRASLSCWLVSSRLKILTTCTQEFFHNVTIVCVTSKNILQPHFHGG